MATRTGWITAHFGSLNSTGSRIPVEVRDVKTSMVKGRGFAGERIAVDPGRYVVSSRLPDGSEASSPDVVVVDPDSDEPVALEQDSFTVPSVAEFDIDAFKISPSIRLPRSITTHGNFSVVGTTEDFVLPESVSPMEFPGPASILLDESMSLGPPRLIEVDLREAILGSSKPSDDVLRWWLNGKLLPIAESHSISAHGQPVFAVTRSALHVQLHAIPVAPNVATTVRYFSLPSEGDRIDYSFGDEGTDALWGMVDSKMLMEARAISHRVLRSASELVENKVESPIGGILGAYVLLRANELKYLIERSGTLAQIAGWSPDAHAIHAEVLARLGRHKEAVEQLLKACSVGMPCFRSGVTYMTERLEFYGSIDEQDGQEIGLSSRSREVLRTNKAVFAKGAQWLSDHHTICRYIIPTTQTSRRLPV